MMPRGVKSGCAQSGCQVKGWSGCPVGVSSQGSAQSRGGRGVKSRECPVKGWSGCPVGVSSQGSASGCPVGVPSRGAQSGCPVGVPSRGAQSDILNLFNHACRYKWT